MNALVFAENRQAVTDSLKIAKVFKKRHDRVLQGTVLFEVIGEHQFMKDGLKEILECYRPGTKAYKIAKSALATITAEKEKVV